MAHVLRLLVVVLAHSVLVHTVVAILPPLILSTTTEIVILEIASSSAIVHSTSTSKTAIILTVVASHWLGWPTTLILLVLPLWFPWSLITVLVLDALLRENQLLRSELVSWFTKFLITMGEVALLLKQAIFVGLIMPAAFGLIFLIEFLPLLRRWLWETLVHCHLVVNHLLLWETSLLPIVWHHAHHSLVVEHLIRHLLVWPLHLLHVHSHLTHVCRHAVHLVLLHLVCSVHIENLKSI